MTAPTRKVLILVENLSVPTDRRVWQEAVSLTRAGSEVVVVSPQGSSRDQERFEFRDGVAIHRFPANQASGGAGGYLREFASAFWHVARLALRLDGIHRFDVVHACNPPDILLLAALPLKLRGVRFIFDVHDLVPELYRTRFGRRGRMLYLALLASEQLSFRLADAVVVTNESYHEVAIRRGRKAPDAVFVVRNGPDAVFLRPARPNPALKRGRRHLIAYVGVMSPQDGVDHALRALALTRQRRDDWRAVFAGDGHAFDDLRLLADELGLGDVVEFTGFVDRATVREILATADVCLAPEPSNPLNDVSTMIKIAEYMSMGVPVVSFDLKESRFTAGPAAVYAVPNDDASFAAAIDELLSDPTRRVEMGALGRRRVEEELSWERSERNLLAAHERALSPRTGGSARAAGN